MIKIEVRNSIEVAEEMSLFISFPFDNKILGILNTQPRRTYHTDLGCWELPKSSLPTLLEKLDGYGVHICGHMDGTTRVDLPDFKTEPFAHQLEGFEFGMAMDAFVLGDEQGLGKTKQVIDIAVANKHKYKHCLIITAVNGLKWNWQKEVETHSHETAHILGTRTKKKGGVKIGSNKDKLHDLNNLPDDYFIITNVETLRHSERVTIKSGRKKTEYPIVDRLKQLCEDGVMGIVAIDEIHKCKNHASQVGKALLKLEPERRIAMTGTPLMNNPLDLYMILKWLGHEEHTFKQFKEHYCILGGMGNEIVGYKNLSQLRELLDSVMIRRLKKEVTDLPDKVHSIEYVEMGKKQQKIYNDVLQKIKDNIDLIRLSPMPLAELIRLRQATGYTGILSSTIQESCKFDRMEELVEEYTQAGHKVVIFSNWTAITDPAVERLRRFNPAVITGKTKDRVKEEEMFMTDPDCKVIVGTIGAMGTGLTLTAAQYVIFLDEPWNRALKDQAEDRTHRIGTVGTISVITLLCRNTLDERINELVRTKGAMADLLVDGKASNSMGLLLDYIMK